MASLAAQQRQTVLVVEDEQELRELLRRYLEREGFTVVTTGSGAEGLVLLEDPSIDLAVVDLGLPDVDGEELVVDAHRRGRPAVVVLTARSEVSDRIRGLELGADDYMTKPFSARELVLRVHAVLARVCGDRGPVSRTSYGGGLLVVDADRHTVEVDGRPVELTPTEWGVLVTLAASPGRVVTRYELVNRVRGYEFDGYERTIDTHVKNLRRKLRGAAAGARTDHVVETVLGVGYRLGLARDA